jgi:hypothetical protein
MSLRDKQSPDYLAVLLPLGGLALLIWFMMH